MYFSSVGGKYLKAQTQNNNAKVRCDHYKREITKKHVHSLATINKNIQDMQDFLKDIKASTGYFKDVHEFRSLYQPNAVPSVVNEIPDLDILDFNKTHFGRSSPQISDLSETVVKRKMSRQPEQVSKMKFEVGQVGEVSQLRDGETEREAECSSPAKNGVRTGKASGHERGRRGYTKGGMRNAKEAEWFVRDENLTEDKDSRRLANISKSAVNEPRSEIIQKERSRSSMKYAFAGDQDAIVQTQLSKEASRYLEPQLAWTDGPLKKRDSPTTSSRAGARVTPVIRSQTAPEKASRLKTHVASASVSEPNQRSSTAKSSSELKKLKVHVTLSKTERQRILQELVCSSTVTPDRSFLEREKQTLLKDKINTFFKSIFDQPDTEQGKNEEDLFCDDEDLQRKKRQ